MKSELQLAKEATRGERKKFAKWLRGKLDKAVRGTLSDLADTIKKDVSMIHKYSVGSQYPVKSTREAIEKYFEETVK